MNVSSLVIDLDQVPIDPRYAHRVPAQFAMRRRLLPLCRIDDQVWVAAESIDDRANISALQRYLAEPLRLVAAERDTLQRALTRVYASQTRRLGVSNGRRPTGTVAAGLDADTEAAETVTLTDELLSAAVLLRASDVHLLPAERNLTVQFRRDGELSPYKELPKEMQSAIIGRLKVLAGMDIAEKRAPQDGRFNLSGLPGQPDIDVRVASMPTRYGERLTLRLLDKRNAEIDLKSLGFTPSQEKQLTDTIRLPHGLILLTGPTGSGKTTTLYAAIHHLLAERYCNVITVEDPVEYEIKRVSQVEIDQTDKVTFHRVLRSMLRHDPDVIMIGEIRDAETADIALKSALTGHLVLSTLHTNTAAGVITRLLDMGIESFLLAATLRMAVAQRLVRKLCPHCRQPHPDPDQQLVLPGVTQRRLARAYLPKGCVYCAGQGYQGRTALIETMPVDRELAQLITSQPNEDLLFEHMRQKQTLLIDDAIEKIENGTTTMGEVLRATVIY